MIQNEETTANENTVETENGENDNEVLMGRVKRLSKKAVTALAVLISLALLALAIISIFKSEVLYHIAEKKCIRGDYLSAMSFLEDSEVDEKEVFEEYIMLRSDIRQQYPSLLMTPDFETVNAWCETVNRIYENREGFSETNLNTMLSLHERLNKICDLYSQYTGMDDEIDDLMDIFTVVNSISSASPDEAGTSFTVRDIKADLERRKEICSSLEEFTTLIPGNENIYLLSYLIGEAKGEYRDIEEVLSAVADSGYSDSDVVRIKTQGKKTFSKVTNANGVSISVADKEEYETFMLESVGRALIKSLSEFYGR